MNIKIIRRFTLPNGTEMAEYEVSGRLSKYTPRGRAERMTEGKNDAELIEAIKDFYTAITNASANRGKPIGDRPPLGSLSWRMDAENGDLPWPPMVDTK